MAHSAMYHLDHIGFQFVWMTKIAIARRLSKQIGYIHFSHIWSYGYQGIDWHFISNAAKGFLSKMNFKGLNLSFKSEKNDCLLVEYTL